MFFSLRVGASPDFFRVAEGAMQPDPEVRQCFWHPEMLARRGRPGTRPIERLSQQRGKARHLGR